MRIAAKQAEKTGCYLYNPAGRFDGTKTALLKHGALRYGNMRKYSSPAIIVLLAFLCPCFSIAFADVPGAPIKPQIHYQDDKKDVDYEELIGIIDDALEEESLRKQEFDEEVDDLVDVLDEIVPPPPLEQEEPPPPEVDYTVAGDKAEELNVKFPRVDMLLQKLDEAVNKISSKKRRPKTWLDAAREHAERERKEEELKWKRASEKKQAEEAQRESAKKEPPVKTEPAEEKPTEGTQTETEPEKTAEKKKAQERPKKKTAKESTPDKTEKKPAQETAPVQAMPVEPVKKKESPARARDKKKEKRLLSDEEPHVTAEELGVEFPRVDRLLDSLDEGDESVPAPPPPLETEPDTKIKNVEIKESKPAPPPPAAADKESQPVSETNAAKPAQPQPRPAPAPEKQEPPSPAPVPSAGQAESDTTTTEETRIEIKTTSKIVVEEEKAAPPEATAEAEKKPADAQEEKAAESELPPPPAPAKIELDDRSEPVTAKAAPKQDTEKATFPETTEEKKPAAEAEKKASAETAKPAPPEPEAAPETKKETQPEPEGQIDRLMKGLGETQEEKDEGREELDFQERIEWLIYDIDMVGEKKEKSAPGTAPSEEPGEEPAEGHEQADDTTKEKEPSAPTAPEPEPAAANEEQPGPPPAEVEKKTEVTPTETPEPQPAPEKEPESPPAAASPAPVEKKAPEPTTEPTGEPDRQTGAQTPPPPEPVPAPGTIVDTSPPPPSIVDNSGAAAPREKKDKEQNVTLSGFRYLKYRMYGAGGSESEFLSREGLTHQSEKVEQGTNLSLNAEIGDKTKLSGSFYEMPRQERDMMFRMEHSHYGTTYGDFTARFEGGQLSPFAKETNGFQVDYSTSLTDVMFLVSKSESQTRTSRFTGRNIKGPYDLNARDIIPDKVTVKLNDQVLSPDEYILDEFLGEISFFEILGPTDVITVTYEQRLTGALTEGDLKGFSIDRKTRNEKWSYGFSHLVKEANRTTQKLREKVDEEVPDLVSGRTLVVDLEQGDLIVKGSEIITKNGVTLETNQDYNKTSDLGGTNITLGEAEIAENYFNFQFLLAQQATATDSFRITYFYYPDNVTEYFSGVNLFHDQEGLLYAYPDATEFTGTIYYGSERVYLCTDETLSAGSCVEQTRGVDYIVNEDFNRVEFMDSEFQDYDYLRIDAYGYPSETLLRSDYDQTVDDFRVEYNPGGGLRFAVETAISEADISAKPITELNAVVREAATEELDCSPEAGNTAACTFDLGREDIVPGSVVLYFDDRLADDSVLSLNSDYLLEVTRGRVIMQTLIPTGTVILADYQYYPPFIGVESGEVVQMDAAYRGKKTSVSASLWSGDTFFTSIGGESNLETGKLTVGIEQQILDNLSIKSNYIEVDTAQDLFETHNTSTEQQKHQLIFSNSFFKTLNLMYEKREKTDDYSPSKTDTTETRSGLNAAFPVPMLRNADMSLAYSSMEHNDNTEQSVGRENTNRKIGFNYKPSSNLQFKTNFNTSETETRNGDDVFTNTNVSSQIGVSWKPHEIVTVKADIDEQSTSDTRPSVSDRDIHSSRVSVSARPEGRLQSLSYSYSQQDRPSVTGPSSGSKTETYNLGYALTRAISFKPSLSMTESFTGDTSRTESETISYKLDYRPPGRPYHMAFTLKNNERNTTNLSGGSTSENNNWDITAGYNPSPVWSYSAQLQNESYSSSRSSGYDTKTFNTRIGRIPNERTNQWFSLQRVSRSGNLNEDNSAIELGSEFKLTEILSLNLYYRMSKYAKQDDDDRDYTGHLFESTFRADF